MRTLNAERTHGGGRLLADVSCALLAIFAFALAGGYGAAASFRASPAPLAPTVSPIMARQPIEPRVASDAALPFTAIPLSIHARRPRDVPAAFNATRSEPSWSVRGKSAVANQPTVALTVDRHAQRFHVEAGAYQTRYLAEAMAEELRRRGYAAHIIPGPRYRVWVGGVLDRPTAERLAAMLQAAGFDAALTMW